jgi:hypothetical protein
MQSCRRRQCALAAITLLLGGCGMGANKEAAEATAAKLYQACSQKDWDSVLKLYSPEFYQKTNREQWRGMILGLNEKLGDYKAHQLKNWQFRTFAGVGGSSQTIVLTYQVQYANGEATETLTFVGSGGEKTLKISGHQITSPALLMPAVSGKPTDAGGIPREKSHP